MLLRHAHQHNDSVSALRGSQTNTKNKTQQAQVKIPKTIVFKGHPKLLRDLPQKGKLTKGAKLQASNWRFITRTHTQSKRLSLWLLCKCTAREAIACARILAIAATAFF
jgi:hypothetical protein